MPLTSAALIHYLHDDLGTVATAHERKRGLPGDGGRM